MCKESLKKNMDASYYLHILSIRITDLAMLMRGSPYAGLFSATLTAFIIDSERCLQVSPADQMVHYLQQDVAILVQIFQQLSSIVPQVAMPSVPPPPYPAFNPSASAIRINVFWLVALCLPIVSCGFFYIFITFAPFINPQSPYRSPFSSLILYLVQIQISLGRIYSDMTSSRTSKLVSSSLMEGQVQLAEEDRGYVNARHEPAIR
ncbi:hypothetical protein BJV78DRAFT_366963 [Lactifluus subvellereus]|nr:hypothetical protein BJV78DRAFT_366963 [Lactifluus subvellereus]